MNQESQKSKQTPAPPLQALYHQLGLAIAQVVIHPDCPVWLHNDLTAVVIEVLNRASSAKPRSINMFYAHNLDYFMHILDSPVQKKGGA